jgi:enoyl-CoA hydratase
MAQIETELNGHVLTVTLNRPERRNAMNMGALSSLADVWERVDREPAIRAAVLTGAGGTFCAGMDLRAMVGDPADPDSAAAAERVKTDPGFALRGFLKVGRPRKPIIAAVEGNAIAGGMELVLGSDIRVAASDARFGLSELKWALYPGAGGIVRLSRQIPFAIASDIILTGRHIGAAEAHAHGIVSRLTEPGLTLATAQEIAAQVAGNGPLSVAAALRTLRETQGMSESEAFDFEQPAITAIFASQDAKEGPRAFAERRGPVFQGC